MVNRIARFEKVSFAQFLADYLDTFQLNPELHEIEQIRALYDKVSLPVRATVGSAGYDFKAIMDIVLYPEESIKIPTAIRCEIKDNWMLQLYPRSGLGTKYRMQIDNTIGIIDSDYYGSRNEGHIFVKITNDSKEGKVLNIKTGDAFVQGIFLPYGITYEDEVIEIRNGGFGSTGK